MLFQLTNGATARDDIIVASNLVRKAKEELRVAAATSRVWSADSFIGHMNN